MGYQKQHKGPEEIKDAVLLAQGEPEVEMNDEEKFLHKYIGLRVINELTVS